jgi:hypothetical protein
LNLVYYFIAIAAHWNLADDELQYHLAEKTSAPVSNPPLTSTSLRSKSNGQK